MTILPQPQKFEKISGSFSIEETSQIYCNVEFLRQAELFADMVFAGSNIKLSFTDDISQAKIIFNKDDSVASEGYIIMLSQGQATVTCHDQAGCFYAVQTLRQLFYLDREQTEITCENCYIEDRPKFRYRGLLIDICRHFFDLTTLKRIADLMSQVKLNKLHLHLSDDQGFRMQIDKYPALNEIASVRAGSEVVANGKRYIDEEPHGGYLTKDELKELVAYAAERNIEVVPEIDLPGHFVAALAAYPEFCCTGQVTEVRKQWGISKDILCAGNDATYGFVQDILDEVCEVFPSEFIHLGGDEAPKDRWCNCKLCRERLSELQLANFDELQTWMVEQFRKYLEEKGKTVICWNDGVTKSASCEIVSQVWKPFTHNEGVKEANSGRKVIMSPFFKMYFDYPYAMTPLNKTLHFNPLKGVKKANQSNVLGVEGCVWTEHIATEDKLFFNLLPRLDALAEVALGYGSNSFGKRLKKRYELYDKLGLVYNARATVNKTRRIRIVKKFFKKDANVELNVYLDRQK